MPRWVASAPAQVRPAMNSVTVPIATQDKPARKKRFCLFMTIAPVSALRSSKSLPGGSFAKHAPVLNVLHCA
jgi:hypothetical protein